MLYTQHSMVVYLIIDHDMYKLYSKHTGLHKTCIDSNAMFIELQLCDFFKLRLQNQECNVLRIVDHYCCSYQIDLHTTLLLFPQKVRG